MKENYNYEQEKLCRLWCIEHQVIFVRMSDKGFHYNNTHNEDCYIDLEHIYGDIDVSNKSLK